MNLSKDLSEFIGLLHSTGVKYLIVGGHAVAFHGHPRFTGVVDFFAEGQRPEFIPASGNARGLGATHFLRAKGPSHCSTGQPG